IDSGLRSRLGGVNFAVPAHIAVAGAKSEINGLMMRIQDEGEGVADDALSTLVHLFDLVPGESHAETTDLSGCPVRGSHFLAIRFHPIQILDLSAVNGTTWENSPTPEDWLGAAQSEQLAHKGKQRFLLSTVIPPEPGEGIILAVGVVVALLRVTKFISRQQH